MTLKTRWLPSSVDQALKGASTRPRALSLSIVCGLLVAATYGCSASRTTAGAGPDHAAKSAKSAAQRAAIPGAPAGTTAFIGVSVIPMDEERTLANYTVLVRNGRIAEMGPAGKVHIPKDAVKIDATGQYLIPGLADMHAHLFHSLHGERLTGAAARGSWTDTLRARRRLALWLANGVTTVRNMDHAFTEPSKLSLQLKAEAASGTVLSPRIYTAGRWRSLGTNESLATIQSQWPALGDIEKRLVEYKNEGFDFIKPYYEPKPIYDSLVTIAKRLGIPVAGHIPQGVTLQYALHHTTSIEHPMPEWDRTVDVRAPKAENLQALADSMYSTNIWHCPTQSHYVALHGFPVANGILNKLNQRGVHLLLGTDEPPRAGIMARELASLVAEGLTPFQALSTGTRNVAQYFGTTADVGTVTVGKRADLVLLSTNPLADVNATATPIGVMVGGRWLTKAAIDERIAALAD